VHRREANGGGGEEINVTDVPLSERSREKLLFCFSSVSRIGHRMPKTLSRQTFSNVSHVMNESFLCKTDYLSLQYFYWFILSVTKRKFTSSYSLT
jgi:hypothetical protein